MNYSTVNILFTFYQMDPKPNPENLRGGQPSYFTYKPTYNPIHSPTYKPTSNIWSLTSCFILGMIVTRLIIRK